MSTLIPTGFDNITVLRGSKYIGVWDWEDCDFTGNTATIKIKNIHEQFKDVKNVYEVGVATVCPLDIDGNPYTNRIQIELSKEDTLKFAIPDEEEFSFDDESGYYSILNITLDDGTVVLTANVKVVNSLEAETLNFLLDEKDEAIIINGKLDDILLRNDEYISVRDNLIDVVIPEAINTYDEKLQAYNLNHIEKVQILEDIATIVGQDKNIVGQDKLDIETMKQNVQDNKDSVTSMKDAIEIMLDTFDDRFLGKKDLDPTTDNDGEPLSIAALYYNEIDKELKFYNGVSWDSPVAAAQTYAQQASQSADSANTSKLATAQLKSDVEGIRDSLQASVNDIANKVNISDVQDLLNSTDPTKPLSANQGRILKGFIDNINAVLNSDDTTLDELQEIVNFIKQNKATLDALSISNIAGLQSALNAKAALSSPALTGTPTINGVNVSGYSGFKNYIINGGFDIWQRGTNPITISGETFNADRWLGWHSSGGTISPSSGAIGFASSVLVSGASAGGAFVNQKIEAINTINLGIEGNTKTTISFYCKADVAGSNIKVEIRIPNAQDSWTGYTTPKSVIVGTTSTDWTKYTVTFDLDFVYWTGIALVINGVSGVTNFYVCGVQLEKGSVATPFEQRPIGLELSLCQRYYEANIKCGYVGSPFNAGYSYGGVFTMSAKRVQPTFTLVYDESYSNFPPGIPTIDEITLSGFRAYKNATVAGGQATWSSLLNASAEL